MARQARSIFKGSIPPILLAQIMKGVDFTDWQSVWVGCSGTFSFERAVSLAHRGKPVFSNDVSFLSALIWSIASKTTLDFEFVGPLAYWEDLLAGRPYFDRAAAAVLVMKLHGTYQGNNAFTRKHWKHYEDALDESLERPKERLAQMADEIKSVSYFPGDFRKHLDRCIAEGGGFIVSAPFVEGFYEEWFKFINTNIRWTEPAYDLWNPEQFPALIEQIEDAGIPYLAVYKQPLPGKQLVAYHKMGMHPPFFVMSNTPAKGSTLVDVTSAGAGERFAFEAVDITRLTANSEVSIYACSGKHADYVKKLYLQENIPFTSGMANFLVYIDDMLAGVMTYSSLSRNFAGGWHSRNAIYLLSDTSTSRFGRVFKLVAMLATCEDVLRVVQDRIVHRRIGQVITTVRSNNPVSMKYRGIYDKIVVKEAGPEEQSGSKFIISYGSAPRAQTPQQIYAEWWKRHFKDDRDRKVTNSYATKADPESQAAE